MATGEPIAPTSASDLIKSRCLLCHDTALISQQRLTEAGWRREVDRMIAWGAPVAPGEREALIAELARLYPAHPIAR
jgi:hypothetical protein